MSIYLFLVGIVLLFMFVVIPCAYVFIVVLFI